MSKAVRTDRNVVVVIGRLRRAPEQRVLPDGTAILELEVVSAADGVSATIPVTWVTTSVPSWGDGQSVAVLGAVRRRFYRAGGATVSRTDVLASMVLSGHQAGRITAALSRAAAAVESN